MNNPGPCGASAVLYREGMISTPIPSGKAVCRYGTSYQGELNGLDMAISDIVEMDATDITEVNIFCDCEAAILSTQNTAMYNSAKEIKTIRENTMKLHKKGINVKISHVPGHVDLLPNEIADQTAKTAAKEAINAGEGSVDLQLIKKTVRKVAMKKWNRSWRNTSSSNIIYHRSPNVPTSSYTCTSGRTGTVNWVRLISGHNRLKVNMFKMKLTEHPNCDCGTGREDAEHVLLTCPKYNEQRTRMFEKIEESFKNNNTRLDRRRIDINTLLNPETRTVVEGQTRAAMLEFIFSAQIHL